MPDAPSRASTPLAAHDALSATTIHGWPAVAFALPFAAAGAAFVLIGADVWHRPDAEFGAPRFVVALCGALFGSAGLWLGAHGLRGVALRRRAAAAGPMLAAAPWRFDRAWHRDGEDAPRWASLVRPAGQTLVFGLFAALALSLGFASDEAPALVRVAATGFALIVLLPLSQLVTRFASAVRWGRTYVRWERFPAFVGERLTLRFGTEDDAPPFTRLRFVLRCVEERYAERGRGGDRTSAVVCTALHRDERVLDTPSAMPRARTDAVVRFDLPADLPGNDLLARPARWWEVEVVGEAPGVDYRQRFLLPVYARPGDERAEALAGIAAALPVAVR